MSANSDESSVRDESVQRRQTVHVGEFSVLRVAAQKRSHPGVMHRHEDGVSSDETEPEMQSGHSLVHHAAEHLREPVVSRCENAEDGRNAHDQMKMRNNKKRLVQRNIQNRLRQERPADSTRNKQRNESNRKQHGWSEPDLSAPQRPDPVNCHHRHRKGGVWADTAHEHVVAPNHESQNSDGQHGVHHGLVSEDWLARKHRHQL